MQVHNFAGLDIENFGPACRRHCTSSHARPCIPIDPLPSVNRPSALGAFVRLSSVVTALLFTIAIETTTMDKSESVESRVVASFLGWAYKVLYNEASVTYLLWTTHGHREIAVGVAARVVRGGGDLFTIYAAYDCSRCRSSVTVGNFNLENLERSEVDGSHDHTMSWFCVNGVERATSFSTCGVYGFRSTSAIGIHRRFKFVCQQQDRLSLG